MVKHVAVVILAAGLGKRTGSKLPKVLIESREKRPLVYYVLETVEEIQPEQLSVVVGYEAESVTSAVKALLPATFKTTFNHQKQQLGTGDAVKAAKDALKDFQGPVVILYGDMPLIKSATLQNLIETHESEKATLSLVTVSLPYDNSFGRITRDKQGNVNGIVERKDCTSAEVGIAEKNLGIYCVDSSFLFPALDRLTNNNAQSEYYLTDIVKLAASEGQRISTVCCSHPEEALGVNDGQDLNLVNEALRSQQVARHAARGVRFLAPASVLIDPDVEIGLNVTVGPSVQLLGKTQVGEGTVIEGSAIIRDSKIGKNCILRLGSYLTEAALSDQVNIGPFVQLRPGTVLGNEVRIGNFVELKNAQLGVGAKANHLSYLGDCEIGDHSNIGAGTITCNYDGVKKSKTKIGSDVFVGSNSTLIAPVELGAESYIGAGSVISKDVEPGALALTRPDLKVKSGWGKKRQEQTKAKKR